jgi:small-conductance mechanosensitive channel
MEQYFPDWLMILWNQEVSGNSFGALIQAIFVFFALLIGVRIFRGIVLLRLAAIARKKISKWDDKIVTVVRKISNVFYLMFSLFATVEFFLVLPPYLERVIQSAFIVSLAYESLQLTQRFISFSLKRSALGKNETSLHGIKLISNIALWSIGTLLVLENLGFDITTLAASLGIGGIAIALAAQNILGDLFSSFSLYFDKPFQVGDYILLGMHEGTVKKIGLKTTRIETLRGEELVIPNSELTRAQIQNFNKMQKRRVTCRIGVTYNTPYAKLKKIPEILRKIIQENKNIEFGRAHFASFDDFALGFELVYFVLSRDYAEMMDAQQEVNFEIVKLFEKEKIEMAYPTQTIYLKKN